jgi:hypothetical protein
MLLQSAAARVCSMTPGGATPEVSICMAPLAEPLRSHKNACAGVDGLQTEGWSGPGASFGKASRLGARLQSQRLAACG